MIAVTKFALPHMRRGGSIVNSSSVAAYMVRCRHRSTADQGRAIQSCPADLQ